MASNQGEEEVGGKKEEVKKCGSCNKTVANGIDCSACEQWYHWKCQKISEEKFVFLTHPDNADAHWFCSSCNKYAPKIFKMFAAVHSRQDKIEEEVEKVKESVQEVRKELVELTQRVNEGNSKLGYAEAVKTHQFEEKLIIEKKVSEEVKMVMEEKVEIDRRKGNIIIWNVKESDVDDEREVGVSPDTEMAKEILRDGLRMDAERHIDEVGRIGRYQAGKMRPLRIKVKSEESKFEIFKRAKNLKENESFKKVYITHDLTRKQQAEDKVLRTKLVAIRVDNPSAIIRNGKIVKKKTDGSFEVVEEKQSKNGTQNVMTQGD